MPKEYMHMIVVDKKTGKPRTVVVEQTAANRKLIDTFNKKFNTDIRHRRYLDEKLK